MHGTNWRSRNPIELSGTGNSALCLADRTAQSIRRRSENIYAIDLRDATLAERATTEGMAEHRYARSCERGDIAVGLISATP